MDGRITPSYDERLTLKPAEAARALGIGRSKVYDLIARGEIPSIRFGGSIRVPLSALRALVDSAAEPVGAAR